MSRYLHDLCFDDHSQSLCSRAYAHQDDHWFWWVWVRVFTKAHCKAARQRWHGGPPGTP